MRRQCVDDTAESSISAGRVKRRVVHSGCCSGIFFRMGRLDDGILDGYPGFLTHEDVLHASGSTDRGIYAGSVKSREVKAGPQQRKLSGQAPKVIAPARHAALREPEATAGLG